jgi:hypothetical protein
MQPAESNENSLLYPTRLWLLGLLLILGYVIFVVWSISYRGLFEYVGVDYRLWYSSGMIARYHGFASIYDDKLQTLYQLPLYERYARITPISMQFWPLPLPYLSVFIVPMLLLTFIPPVSGFLLWSLINIVGTVFYIFRFLRRNDIVIPRENIFLVTLALPFFLNILFGQINLWLLIVLGESITALRKGQDFKSGAWLAGMLLKPQTLLLLIPGYILVKKFKALTGFMILALVIITASLSLAGITAISGPFNVIAGWPTILGDSGMNFLSFSTNMTKIFPVLYSQVVSMICTIITLIAAMWLWLPRNRPLASDNLEWIFLATYAATCAISPHSNVHMAIPMLALGLVVFAKGQIPPRLALGWIVIPSILFLFAIFVSIGYAHALGGMSILGMNIALLFWMVWKKSHLTGEVSSP